ncbi:acetyltransferase [Actibacterium mucosum KCTC 23349]|uniref:Acetyltransferase n=1 Tax=Actibacterium mucosum KCTC 23349 TaxID=1454373 RepID=A0A037ZLG1_9RHOB|nr:GNAT family N-acetyltransferase [Actibacterium mucosum]KAJ56469.1 acetyltransferase [Actibacterium mucosum KCTC 23349]
MSGFHVRTATKRDISAIDLLLARSYPALLKADYPPSVLVTALPLISYANPGLVTCGSYYVVTDEAGQIVGAGGWTRSAPGGGGIQSGVGHIRHVVTDHRATRQGVGRKLMTHVIDRALDAGVVRLECLSTRTAEPFYRAMGFNSRGAVDLTLRPGIQFPAIDMWRVQ